VGECSADTASPTSKAMGRTCPFKTVHRAQVQDFTFPPSSSSRARIPLSTLFRNRFLRFLPVRDSATVMSNWTRSNVSRE
jgi:hypothetical protein